MTDHVAGFVVTLDHDVREDDVDSTIEAIKHIRGVLSVEPVVADLAVHFAQQRIRHEIADRLYLLIEEFRQ